MNARWLRSVAARALEALAMLLACVALFSVPTPAQAQRWVACSLPLAPHTMPDAQGQAAGYASEVLLAVARQLDWSLEVRYMPWLRVVHEAQLGHCDLVYTVLRRSDYEQFLLYPREAVQQRRNVLLVRADSDIRFDGDLERFMRQHTVGLYQDKAVDERFERLRRAPWARVDISIDAAQNMSKLLHGRFDAAIENDMTAVHELRQLGRLKEVTILQPALNTVPAYIAFPRAGRLVAQMARFDRAMAAFRKSPQFEAINHRYRGTARPPPDSPPP